MAREREESRLSPGFCLVPEKRWGCSCLIKGAQEEEQISSGGSGENGMDLDMSKLRCLVRAKRRFSSVGGVFVLELRRIRTNNYVKVETLGEPEGECIECEEQDTQGRSWQE